MPIFEYACNDCHHDFEALVRSGSVPRVPPRQTAHPSTQLTKQLSVFATATATPERAPRPAMAAPCGSCGHPGGPGACALH